MESLAHQVGYLYQVVEVADGLYEVLVPGYRFGGPEFSEPYHDLVHERIVEPVIGRSDEGRVVQFGFPQFGLSPIANGQFRPPFRQFPFLRKDGTLLDLRKLLRGRIRILGHEAFVHDPVGLVVNQEDPEPFGHQYGHVISSP